MKFLGNRFDIHTGSRELVFPHHENEVAIARAARGATLANCWLHCDPVQYDGSLEADKIESITLDDLVNQGWDLKTIRFWLMSNHYRKTLVLSEQSLRQAQYTLDKVNRCMAVLNTIESGSPFLEIDQFLYDIKQNFIRAMADDLKISGVISSILAVVKTLNRKSSENAIDPESAKKLIQCFKGFDRVLRIFNFEKKTEYSKKVQDLIRQRETARMQNNWDQADKIREQLTALGVTVKDKKADA
jgi:cysteinyl-tRNA synthetase